MIFLIKKMLKIKPEKESYLFTIIDLDCASAIASGANMLQ